MPAFLAHRDRAVLRPRLLAAEIGELVVVRREQRARADAIVEVLGDRPGDRQAVEGRRAAADLVEDHQARRVAWWRMLAVSIISTMKVEWPRARLSDAPTRVKTRSHNPMRAVFAGTKQPDWAMIDAERHLPHHRALARHVRPGDDQHLTLVSIEPHVVGDEADAAEQLLDDRVATLDDVDDARRRRSRAARSPTPTTLGRRTPARRLSPPRRPPRASVLRQGDDLAPAARRTGAARARSASRRPTAPSLRSS